MFGAFSDFYFQLYCCQDHCVTDVDLSPKFEKIFSSFFKAFSKKKIYIYIYIYIYIEIEKNSLVAAKQKFVP